MLALTIFRQFIERTFDDSIVADLLPVTYYMIQKKAMPDPHKPDERGDAPQAGSSIGRVYEVCPGPRDDYAFPYVPQCSRNSKKKASRPESICIRLFVL